MSTQIRYANDKYGDFARDLRKRVNSYFKENNIDKTANSNMVIKTLFMLSVYIIPFVLILTNTFSGFGLNVLMFIVMGLGMAGIGLSVMHDANHASYSKNNKINNWIGRVIYLIGGNPINWKIQHNVLHHTYTNVDGLDQDLDSVSILRFSPHQKRKKVHKFQFLYAWFFYGLLTVNWMTAKEFVQLKRFHEMGLLKAEKKNLKQLLTDLILAKGFYFMVFLFLPLLFSNLVWWQVLLGFFIMHFIAGFTLAVIFQSAHVMPEMEYPELNEENKLPGNIMAHQLITTTNFATGNPVISWLVGGLNFQVEHHLFPNICHVHYKKISGIVEQTAKEYGLPYHSKKTFVGAVLAHGKVLKLFGERDDLKFSI